MEGTVAVPVWLLVLVGLLAAVTLVNHFVLPGARWFLRRRVNRVITEVNSRLRLEIPTFQLTKRQVLVDRLVYDPEVMEVVAAAAAERSVPRDGVMAEVVTYAREMVPAFNPWFYFRIGFRLARRFFRLFYRVRMGYLDAQLPAKVDADTDVVFFMNHRSNMDYFLVTYLASGSAALSYGAGEWARIWPFSQVLRFAGAYIVRRDTSDPVYRKVLERYVQMATEGGVPHAMFPEGKLSRDGRLQAPKLGLLGYITKTFDPKGARDILFMPVAVNFDRIVEERTLVENQETDYRGRGGRFVLGSSLRFVLRELWRAVTARWVGFGNASASFGKPISLKAWLKRHRVDLRKLDRAARFERIDRLARELMDEISRVMPVLPVPLIAAALLEAPGEAREADALKRRAGALADELIGAGAQMPIPEAERAAALDKAFDSLCQRGLIVRGEAGYAANPEDVPLLRRYVNSIAHLIPAPERMAAQ
ncbi:MAG: 1-acyl-sn-glycerol-3-phosphate acyltransferase [Alphaproteobacteria bacterium]|nr:1-acyl-sn-glycerol-3-phosphate acyltransferase [Alphaproteobacteria bacterium]